MLALFARALCVGALGCELASAFGLGDHQLGSAVLADHLTLLVGSC